MPTTRKHTGTPSASTVSRGEAAPHGGQDTGIGEVTRGAAVGAALGAAAGNLAGPVGVVAGAIIGGTAGAVAGNAVTQEVDAEAETAYWRENFRARPYYEEGLTFEDYAPAYRAGWEARGRFPAQPWEEVEPGLAVEWRTARGTSNLPWERAKAASRDAWERLAQQAGAVS